jgi:hypothetical protein
MTFGMGNYIERYYRIFEERTMRFYSNFPLRKEEKAIKRISGLLRLFAYWYNHMRTHETFKRKVPTAYLDGITLVAGNSYYPRSSLIELTQNEND